MQPRNSANKLIAGVVFTAWCISWRAAAAPAALTSFRSSLQNFFGCSEGLTSIINRAAETAQIYDKNGNLIRIRRDESSLQMQEYRRKLAALENAKLHGGGSSDWCKMFNCPGGTAGIGAPDIQKQIDDLKKRQRALLQTLNCSNLMNAVGQQFLDLLERIKKDHAPSHSISDDEINALKAKLGPEWLDPLLANQRIDKIEKCISEQCGRWVKMTDEAEVQALCNKGVIVVGAWRNPDWPKDQNAHGHVAVCAPNPGKPRNDEPLVRDGNEHLGTVVVDKNTGKTEPRLNPGGYGAISSSKAFCYPGSNTCSQPTPPTWYEWVPSPELNLCK